jgi:hypothetical protein
VVHLGGHHLTAASALFEYVDASRTMAMPGAIVIAGRSTVFWRCRDRFGTGWPALPWGHLGTGPRPPSLQSLEEAGVDMAKLELMIDELFHFDSMSPPMALAGGQMRGAVEAAFASMVMYYNDRVGSGEMNIVVVAMLDACSRAYGSADSAGTLADWSKKIAYQFNQDNLHLTSKEADTGTNRIVEAVQQLGRSLGEVHSKLAAVLEAVTVISQLRTLVDELQAVARARTPAMSVSPSVAVRSPSPCTMLLPSVRGNMSVPSTPTRTITDVHAETFYCDCMSNQGQVPSNVTQKQHKSKAMMMLQYFNAMATKDERNEMLPDSVGSVRTPERRSEWRGRQREIAKLISNLLKGWLSDMFQGHSITSRSLKAETPLLVGGIDDRVRELKDKAEVPKMKPDQLELKFAEWRSRNEQRFAPSKKRKH